MEIFEFKKNLTKRLEECMMVLSWSEKLIPASQVREEWSYYIQLQIEPTGWQALWKIPRTICEDLKIQFPTVVFGMVEDVIFKELKAIFVVQAVEENNLHLPERQEVNLEDIYPTMIQENDALNIERTAECLDNLRFFYKNIWMPWDYDNDDDIDWAKKHLESRMQFFYDLQKKVIKRPIANHIKNLLNEARYIQSKRHYLELELSDDEELDEGLSKTDVAGLMKMHLRLTIIKNELELLENPQMRKLYEDLKTKGLSETVKGCKVANAYLVTKPDTIDNQKLALDLCMNQVGSKTEIQIYHNLQDTLNSCEARDKIYLNWGIYSIKFYEFLNDNGMLFGLNSKNSKETIICSVENESVLLTFDGDYTLENLTLDCKNVRTGIIVKSGNLKIINCKIKGDEASSTKQGIHVFPNSSVVIEGSEIYNFAVGLKVFNCSSATIQNSVFDCCYNAVEIDEKSKVHVKDLKVSNSKTIGIYYESKNLGVDDKRIILSDLHDLNNFNIPLYGNCSFENNIQNIVIYNRKLKANKEVIDCLSDDSFELLSNESGSIGDTTMESVGKNNSVIVVDSSE